MMQCGAASGRGTGPMVGSKRGIRQEFVLSVAAHAGLLLGVFVLGANSVRSVPPEAMTVEIVPANEAPPIESEHVDGTPLESTSTGSELSSTSKKGSASEAPPQPKAALPSLQEAQARVNPQQSASSAAAQPRTAAPAEPETQPQASEPLLPPTAPPTLEPQPHPTQAENQPNAGEMFAMPLALPGGRLGGGFDAPAANPAMLPHDDIAAFRARLSSCSQLPPGFTVDDDKLAIVVRVSFKRDGTLAAAPKLLDAPLSPDVAAMMQTAVDALQRCQPFTELPADKYNRWKTLDLVVTPLALSGG
jgi:hypothetical protein